MTNSEAILENILIEIRNNIPISILILVNGAININERNKLYDQSYKTLIDILNKYKKEYNICYLRCVISTSDGKVTVDTFKSVEENILATNSNPINENHNTRPVIMKAIEKGLSGPEIKISNTTSNQEIRMSLRIGDNTEEPIGVISLSTIIEINKDFININKYNNSKNKKIIIR